MRILMIIISAIFFAVNVKAAEFEIRSTGFNSQGRIPVVYTCDGKNISPQLHWINAPSNSQSFALIFSCPDCILGTNYLWVLYNIPKTTTELSEGANNNLPQGILEGNNSFGDTIYRGPCAPDDRLHHYVYTIYALDAKLDLTAEAELEEVLRQIRYHLINHAELIGVFDH